MYRIVIIKNKYLYIQRKEENKERDRTKERERILTAP
jgi:hypothetical protein